MNTSIYLNRLRLYSVLLNGILALLFSLACSSSRAASLPGNTTLPVTFATTVEAGKAKINDPIRVHTMQTVILPDGTRVPKGTVVVGHISQSVPFQFDQTPYATQKPSLLGIHFDQIELKDGPRPVSFEVRAIAGAYAVDDASRPINATEQQMTGTYVQIGGDTYWPPDEKIRSRSGDIVAYVRKDGIFARPLAAEANNAETGIACDAISREQAVAVFSAAACGLYGISDAVLENNGSDGSGTFVLTSNRRSVFILARSAALLEVLP
jgi:hypothetical protein